ncbi:MAG TPA: cytochrome c3 family protein [Amaricoccus sp.]|uniref:multiheme c-type cytochrome n=1 Tax=Amaricoccus sp. TaxID=1872485 RepID=UPI002C449281|nr:multiheme c-type cytochrome [Amaricoccus sp.]HMQ91857.1 cytochrome c3 family protein [Amaricoccus sp.]HMR53420.1 cytochrome c3 family protein [Amaricoccus sp.]HMR60549.1 cytochrome c3 family protein [Amaricoccus sp.]HMU00383.1 cytochrome c3 family protein [Amaricoccus sp.]
MRRWLAAGPVLVAALCLLAPALRANEAPRQRYVGSDSCTECHGQIAGLWAGSDHALAWTRPTEASVLGDFDDASFEHGGISARFFRQDGGFAIETEDAAGVPRVFRVVGVAGIRPLQQYLLEAGPGRTQAFDIAWDVERGRWYPLYPDQQLQPGDGMHWTGPYKSWEARCAECHATGFRRRYDPATRSYSPEEAEIGVGCEACHGPSSAHLDWAKDPAAYDPTQWPGLTPEGFTVDLAASAETQIGQCGGCHSRREAFFDGNPVPGTPYHDAYSLSLLREGLYHADGSIQDEVYVMGSFLQSRMYARGVRCSDCHDPHSTELRAEGNSVCTQCHSPAANPRFPTLRKADYDTPEHHFHQAGSEGAQCRNCHMIERTYMGIDDRRDHSFRVPRPDLAAETGAPDACTDCHSGRDAAWAAAEIAARFPESTRRGPHFSTVFAAARWSPEAQRSELLALARDAEAAGIVRATAIEMLSLTADAEIAREGAALLDDPDPLVRAAATALQRGAEPQDRMTRLLPALRDPLRSVRAAAAKVTIDATEPEDAAEGAALRRARAEWRAALASRRDFPETHLQTGGAALTLRDWDAAVAAFGEAVSLDPQLVDGWSMIVRILAATGREAEARNALAAALAANPGNPTLLSLR